MNDEKLLREALGDRYRDFEAKPLTQDEIVAVISHCESEYKRTDLDPELKEFYVRAIEVLRENIVH